MNFLKVREVAQKLNISRSSVYEFMRRGNFPQPYKFGKTIRWNEVDIEDWAKSQIREG